ncbi:MAG: mycofactocin precursor [Patulibacter sp.]|nr:mycofactocin precursor [Patulibacter sp.]
MTDPVAENQEVEATETAPVETSTEALVDEQLLIEDVSIDGMCGVY